MKLKFNRILLESDLSKEIGYYYDDDFILVTAFRRDRASSHKQNIKDNLMFHESMKKDITNKGFDLVPVKAGYVETPENPYQHGVEEDSILVTANDTTKMDIKELGALLAEKYGQKTFFWKPNDESDEGYFIDYNGKVDKAVTVKSPDDVTRAFAEYLNDKEDMFDLSF